MRQIATLPDEEQARKLADYLLTLKIETRLERQPAGWEVWVCDEDRVPQARQELTEFTQNPSDSRYTTATRTAVELRQAEEHQEKEYARRQAKFENRLARAAGTGQAPVTFALLIISVVVTLLGKFGEDKSSPVYQALYIAPFRVDGRWVEWQWLNAIREGQV